MQRRGRLWYSSLVLSRTWAIIATLCWSWPSEPIGQVPLRWLEWCFNQCLLRLYYFVAVITSLHIITHGLCSHITQQIFHSVLMVQLSIFIVYLWPYYCNVDNDILSRPTSFPQWRRALACTQRAWTESGVTDGSQGWDKLAKMVSNWRTFNWLSFLLRNSWGFFSVENWFRLFMF